MFYKSLDNDHMCEPHNLMECWPRPAHTDATQGFSLSLNNLFCFLNCFQLSKTKHLTRLGVCWSQTLVHSLTRYANFPFLLSIIIPI